VKLALVTCAVHRPEAWALCEKYIARQIGQPHQWIVLDCDTPETVCTMGQTHIRCSEFAGNESLPSKLYFVATSKIVTGDGIVFCENDDWYSPLWLKFCADKLGNYHLIGESASVYYNVRHRFWYIHNNTAHASLCSTAIRTADLPSLARACEQGNPFVDELLWRAFEKPKMLFNNRKHLVIGIKGMPGRPGYGSGHGAADPSAKPDVDLRVLSALIGGDVEHYKKFYENPYKK
jgi:hypothetical protein